MSNRTFRVIFTLGESPKHSHFTATGGLKRCHKGYKFHSLRGAWMCASEYAGSGWDAFIIRRVPNGWQYVDGVLVVQVAPLPDPFHNA